MAKLIPDLQNTRVIVVVWAMPGCGACDDYLPKFLARIAVYQQHGVPFRVWAVGQAIKAGEIPVLLYDAASEDATLQAFADKLKVTATPTTCVLTHWGSEKVEGAVPDDQIDQLLTAAVRANR